MKRKISSYAGNEPQFYDSPSCCLYTMLTELQQFSYTLVISQADIEDELVITLNMQTFSPVCKTKRSCS